MIAFLAGLMVGGCGGAFAVALCVAARVEPSRESLDRAREAGL